MRDYSILNVVVSNKVSFAPNAYMKYRKIKQEFINENQFDDRHDYAFTHSLYSGYKPEYNIIKLNNGKYPWFTSMIT